MFCSRLKLIAWDMITDLNEGRRYKEGSSAHSNRSHKRSSQSNDKFISKCYCLSSCRRSKWSCSSRCCSKAKIAIFSTMRKIDVSVSHLDVRMRLSGAARFENPNSTFSHVNTMKLKWSSLGCGQKYTRNWHQSSALFCIIIYYPTERENFRYLKK